jgi:hypothetical protein
MTESYVDAPVQFHREFAPSSASDPDPSIQRLRPAPLLVEFTVIKRNRKLSVSPLNACTF